MLGGKPRCPRRPGVGLGRVHTLPVGVSPHGGSGERQVQSTVVKRSIVVEFIELRSCKAPTLPMNCSENQTKRERATIPFL
jgi:hypothetical protein